MTTIIILVIYIAGVYAAYFQLQKWADHDITENGAYETIFQLSLSSWLIYPIYGIVSIIKNCREDSHGN